jgi:predicted ATPase
LDLAEDIRRVRNDHARCPIGENDDEPKFTISSLKRLGNQPLTAKRMRRRDNGYLCRQPLAKLLQSVAISVGVGKTMTAQALGHQACRRGHSALFTKTSRLLSDLAGGHADRTWEVRLKRWARPTVLILDDFAMRDFTVAQADDLYELVTERSSKSTIFTANRQASDWYSLFPNPVVAESILDRIVNTAHHVHMEGKSYRPNKRPGAPVSGRTK